jgi:hypothetical protein
MGIILRIATLSFEIVLFGIKDIGTTCHLEKVFRHLYTPVLNGPKKSMILMQMSLWIKLPTKASPQFKKWRRHKVDNSIKSLLNL